MWVIWIPYGAGKPSLVEREETVTTLCSTGYVHHIAWVAPSAHLLVCLATSFFIWAEKYPLRDNRSSSLFRHKTLNMSTAFTKTVPDDSLPEHLSLRSMILWLKIEGNVPRLRARSAQFVGHLPSSQSAGVRSVS
jgi:hypothetical protein